MPFHVGAYALQLLQLPHKGVQQPPAFRPMSIVAKRSELLSVFRLKMLNCIEVCYPCVLADIHFEIKIKAVE